MINTIIKTIKPLLIALMFVLAALPVLAQQKLTPIDSESNIGFTIKNFGVKTDGDFKGLNGTIIFNEQNPTASQISVSVSAKTIDTDNNNRDGHLRGETYFDVEKFPRLQFASTRFARTTKAGRYQVWGNLTIKGVTKSIEFQVDAVQKLGKWYFTGQFALNRRHFGVGGKSISLADKLDVQLSVVAK